MQDLDCDRQFDAACRFILKLGMTAHGYGSTAMRLESYLTQVTTALGYRGEFRSTPTEIICALQQQDDFWPRMQFVSVSGSGFDNAKMARVGQLVEQVVVGNFSLAEATDRLDAIDQISNPYSNWAIAISYGLVGAGFAVILNGGWWDVGVATLLSLIVFGLVFWAGRQSETIARWLPLVSAFVAGVMATLLHVGLPDLSPVIVTLSAIIVLIPGFPISVGLAELANNHVVSGMANLMNGLVYLAQQVMGAWLGFAAAGLFWPALATAPTSSHAISAHWIWLFLPLLLIGLCTIFQTLRHDFPWTIACCILSYFGVLLGSALVDDNFGTFCGAFVAGIYANLWASHTGRPTSIPLLPAIMVLVSGSIGFRGLIAAASGQGISGWTEFLAMFVIAIAITGGLLVANTIIPPKATL